MQARENLSIEHLTSDGELEDSEASRLKRWPFAASFDQHTTFQEPLLWYSEGSRNAPGNALFRSYKNRARSSASRWHSNCFRYGIRSFHFIGILFECRSPALRHHLDYHVFVRLAQLDDLSRTQLSIITLQFEREPGSKTFKTLTEAGSVKNPNHKTESYSFNKIICACFTYSQDSNRRSSKKIKRGECYGGGQGGCGG
jgi:hypothetical protein